MKAHQTDRDAEEGRVDRSDSHGNHQADVAANRGTREHVPLSLPRSGSSGTLFVRLFVTFGFLWVRRGVFVLNSGPGSGFRPLNLSQK
eukprot:3386687-Amphidinium_carterae.1